MAEAYSADSAVMMDATMEAKPAKSAKGKSKMTSKSMKRMSVGMNAKNAPYPAPVDSDSDDEMVTKVDSDSDSDDEKMSKPGASSSDATNANSGEEVMFAASSPDEAMPESGMTDESPSVDEPEMPDEAPLEDEGPTDVSLLCFVLCDRSTRDQRA
jgi:hypothetical protein